jgi:hypothetical protein
MEVKAMLNKVTDYEIERGDSPEELTKNVKQSMEKGWVPSGPLFTDHKTYLQVMVKFG